MENILKFHSVKKLYIILAFVALFIAVHLIFFVRSVSFNEEVHSFKSNIILNSRLSIAKNDAGPLIPLFAFSLPTFEYTDYYEVIERLPNRRLANGYTVRILPIENSLSNASEINVFGHPRLRGLASHRITFILEPFVIEPGEYRVVL